MADTALLSGLDEIKWRTEFGMEYIRDSGFKPYMGESPMDIIHICRDLKASGAEIRIPLVGRMKGNGVSGNQRLTGNEETMDQYYDPVTWKPYRNAISVSYWEKERSAVDLLAARRPLLKDWASELVKFQIVDQFHSINGVDYASASEAQKDAWLAANADRVLFGAAKGNNSGNDHSASLANVDGTADKLSTSIISLAKRMARTADPHLRPYRTGTQGREFYVLFAHPLCFRDLKESTAMQTANRDARDRNVESNPLFQDGDLIWDGVIIREIPEFWMARNGSDVNASTHLAGVGASSVDVGANFLCGAQSLGFVDKQPVKPIKADVTDYDFFDGVGVMMAHGIKKLSWNNGSGTRKDHGMMTIYCSAAADA